MADMKQYDIEVIHEPSGSHLSYSVITDEVDPDFLDSFMDEISIIVNQVGDIDE